MSGYITAIINDQTYDRLEALVQTGLYGEDIGAVVEHLVMAGVREAVAHGFIPLHCTPAAAPVIKYKCEDCQDGRRNPTTVTHDDKCAKCGELAPVPF